jgi:hypothetical protein
MRFEKLVVLDGHVDNPLYIEIERYTNQGDHPLLGAYKSKCKNVDADNPGINIDITKKAMETIDLSKGFKLRIKSHHHKVKFQSMSVVFSVREG